MPSADRARIAHHEAGHATAHLVLTGEARAVALFDDRSHCSGACGVEVATPPEPGDYAPEALAATYADVRFREAFDEAVCTMAGTAAERLLAGDSWAFRPGDGGATDRRMCLALARRAFPGPLPQAVSNHFEGLAYERALALLHPRWPAVQAVAEALASRGRLTAADVATLYAKNITKS